MRQRLEQADGITYQACSNGASASVQGAGREVSSPPVEGLVWAGRRPTQLNVRMNLTPAAGIVAQKLRILVVKRPLFQWLAGFPRVPPRKVSQGGKFALRKA